MLVVLQQYVVARLELLYQVRFKRERLSLARREYVFKIRYVRYHGDDLGLHTVLGAEILTHAVFEVYCLADVYDLASRVEHLVYARVFGQKGYLLFKRFVHALIIY